MIPQKNSTSSQRQPEQPEREQHGRGAEVLGESRQLVMLEPIRSTVASMALLSSSTIRISSIGPTSSARSTPFSPSQGPTGMTGTATSQFLPEGRFVAECAANAPVAGSEGVPEPLPAAKLGSLHRGQV